MRLECIIYNVDHAYNYYYYYKQAEMTTKYYKKYAAVATSSYIVRASERVKVFVSVCVRVRSPRIEYEM